MNRRCANDKKIGNCSNQNCYGKFWMGWAISVLLFVIVALDFSTAIAQDDPNLPGGQTPAQIKAIENQLDETLLQAEQSVFISAPREQLRPLIRANRAIADNEMARAVSLLGEVLTDPSSESYLVPVMGVEGLSISLRRKAQTTLGRLPANDRELYRLRYSVQAKQMLEKALNEGDLDSVSQVMQRFFFTPAGFDAAMLLGHYHLDQGRPIAAANCFQRITESSEARAIHDPEASVLLATCLMLGDAPDAATTALVNLRANSRQSTIKFQGKPVRLFDDPSDAREWLLKLVGDSPLLQNSLVNQWVMVGGNPQRNARTGLGVPLISPRWSIPVLNNPDLENAVVKQQQELINLESAPIPAVQPLAIGDTIVMRSFDRMIGVDFKTGKRVWVFPPWDFVTDFSQPDEPAKTRKVAVESLRERLWLDSVYGQASSDGKSIFIVPEPGFTVNDEAETDFGIEPAVNRIYNELMSIDIAREGAFRWEVGGESGMDEPKLAKSFFLGSPLPLLDELFVVCQQEAEVKLVCLDADTGKLKWSQSLCSTESLSVSLQDDKFRRLAGVSPSFSNGILVCATGTGALAAVDLSTRSIVWGYQYVTPGRKPVQRIAPGKSSTADPLGGIWRDSSIVIADGKVLFTPVEAQDLVCVNLADGYPAWKKGNLVSSKSNRMDSLFLACIEQGNAILIGETSVRAINVQTGKLTWESKLEGHGKPSGRGYANNGFYFFPTTTEELLQFDLLNGRLVRSIQTRGVLGNLICYRGEVISHGVDRLASFPQDEPQRRILEVAAGKGELTPGLLAIKAQLELQDGNLAAAIKTIEAAYQAQPSRSNENLLLDLIIRVVEEDFASGTAIAEEYREQLLANRRFEYLGANVSGMLRINKPEIALEALLELIKPIDLIKDLRNEMIPISVSGFDLEGLDRSGMMSIRMDLWIASRIKLISAQGSVDLNSRIKHEITEVVSQLEQIHTDPVSLYQSLSVFPVDLIDGDLRRELAQKLSSAGQFLLALRLLDSLNSGGAQARAVADKAELFLANGSAEKAQPLIEQLRTSFSDVEVKGDQIGGEFAKLLTEKYADELIAKPDIVWNRGRAKQVDSSEDGELDSVSRTPLDIQLDEYDQDEYKKYSYRFYSQSGELEILDANGESCYRFFLRRKIASLNGDYNSYVKGRISIRENVALVDVSTEMLAFDWLKLKSGKDPYLWNTAIESGNQDQTIAAVSRQWKEVKTLTESRNYEQRVFVGPASLYGICYLDKGRLICVDSVTGQKRWQRNSILDRARLLGDGENLILWDSKERRADVIELSSGRLLKSNTVPVEAGAVWVSRGSRILVSQLSEPEVDELRTDNDDRPRKRGRRRNEKKPPAKPAAKTLGLYDLVTNRMVWEKTYSRKMMGCLVDFDRIGLLDEKGMLHLVDLQSGEQIFEVDFELSAVQRRLVTAIGIVTRGDKLVFHLKRGETYRHIDVSRLNVDIKYLNYGDTMWEGLMFCVDADGGQKLWRQPVRFDNFQLVQHQPENLPSYFFIRRIEKPDDFGNRQDFLNFTAIDLETGKIMINDMVPQLYPNVVSVSCEPERQEMTLHYATTSVTFKLTNSDDLPPTPIANLTNNNSIPDTEAQSVKTNFDKAVIDASRDETFKRAQAAQKLLPQKRAEEKRRMKAERAGK